MIQELPRIAEELRGGRPVPPVTVRTFLSWFSAQRRGNSIVADIKKQLKEARVITFPDFESAWIDAPIGFALEDSEQATDFGSSADGFSTATVQQVEGELKSGAEVTNRVSRDPTYRVSKLQAANQKIVSIKPDGTVAQAVTLVMAGGYSQLPVMTNERDVKGHSNLEIDRVEASSGSNWRARSRVHGSSPGNPL
jgi:hypothetical protein